MIARRELARTQPLILAGMTWLPISDANHAAWKLRLIVPTSLSISQTCRRQHLKPCLSTCTQVSLGENWWFAGFDWDKIQITENQLVLAILYLRHLVMYKLYPIFFKILRVFPYTWLRARERLVKNWSQTVPGIPFIDRWLVYFMENPTKIDDLIV